MEFISRLDDPRSRTHAYLVRIQRRGLIHSKMFSDGIFKGQEEALRAAIDWRDSLLTTLQPYTLPDLMNMVRRHNVSGIPGVSRTFKLRAGEKQWYWTARWSPAPRSTKTKSFAISKHGEEGAKQLAIQAREDALKAVAGYWIGRRTQSPQA